MKGRPITIVDALASLAPGEGWVIIDEDYDTIQWNRSDMKMPTKKELDLEVERLAIEREKEILDSSMAELKKQENIKSAIAKLSRLGLTVDEAKAVIGI